MAERRTHTAYSTAFGSKEARYAGFIREDGSSRILKKTVETKNHTITISIDWEQENLVMASEGETKD